MTAKNITDPVVLGIEVDISGLVKAAQAVERLAAAAKEARAALDGLVSAAAPVGDVVTSTLGELEQDETPALILAELRGLREDLVTPTIKTGSRNLSIDCLP